MEVGSQEATTHSESTTQTTNKKKLFFEKLHRLRAGYYFDKRAAKRAEKFFATQLFHVEGKWAGTPFKLERWQRRIVRRAFGWMRKATNTRKYRVIFIFIPRKNGKSTTGAGFGLYLTFADNEPGAQVVSAAADKEQAAIVFEMAKRMVDQNPTFEQKCGGVALRRSIAVYPTGSSYKVLSADAFSKHGKNLHGILFDELHAQKNRELVDVLKTSTGSREQPLEIYFTTAGYDRNSICYEYYDYAKKVAEGIIEDEAFLPVIYEAGADDDWTKEATWRKANPNLGVSVSLEYLERECQRAQEIPAYENTFKRLHLNMWTEQESRLIPMEIWDEVATIAVDIEELKGRRCYGGLDLSSTTDLTALGLVFPMDDGKYKVLPYFWLPKEIASLRHRRAGVPYPQWIEEGLIKATEGNVVDYDVLRVDINYLATIFDVREIAIDRWNATQLSTQLDGDGIRIIPFGQGFASMSDPTKHTLGLILSRKLLHGGHKVLRWNAANAAGEQDAGGNLKVSKKKSMEKIDGLVATIMGIGRALAGESQGVSVYESRGIRTT